DARRIRHRLRGMAVTAGAPPRLCGVVRYRARQADACGLRPCVRAAHASRERRRRARGVGFTQPGEPQPGQRLASLPSRQ
ncbi:MAG: hypothetical protein AVDCRST_MAG86-1610, partial [uncultured Truepera sp.]